MPPVLQRRKLSLREGQTVSQGYSARRRQGLGWTPGLCDKGTSSDFKQRTEGFEGTAPTAWGGEIPRTMDSMALTNEGGHFLSHFVLLLYPSDSSSP